MNSLLFRDIIEQIMDKEDITLSELATITKANRTHLSKLRNSKEALPVTDNLVNKIRKQYSTYFDGGQNRQDRIDKILANLKEVREYTIAILSDMGATNKVVLSSLERLEGKPEGTLNDYADSIAERIQNKLLQIQKGK